MTRATYNILIAPIVIFIRVPILLPFWLLMHIGRHAEAAGDYLSARIPGFRS